MDTNTPPAVPQPVETKNPAPVTARDLTWFGAGVIFLGAVFVFAHFCGVTFGD